MATNGTSTSLFSTSSSVGDWCCCCRYISGACRPECKLLILMGKMKSQGDTDSIHKQHSMILVPRDAAGVTIVRPLAVFGHIHDHAEIVFHNVRVPVTNMLLGEGRGFGRLRKSPPRQAPHLVTACTTLISMSV